MFFVFQAHKTPIPYTPLCLSKAVKNATEIQGMKVAHVRTFDPTFGVHIVRLVHHN